MATDIQQGVFYDTPIQGGNEPVTRQRGLDRTQQVGIDPQPPPPVIQGDHETFTTRNQGPHVRGYFDASGIFRADSVADDSTVLHADSGRATGEPNQPPGIARAALTPTDLPTPGRVTAFGETAAQQREAVKAAAIAAGFVVSDAPVEAKNSPSTFAVIASDEGAHDPRHKEGTGPMVFSADQLPTIKRRAVTPLVLPTPKTRVKGKK